MCKRFFTKGQSQWRKMLFIYLCFSVCYCFHASYGVFNPANVSFCKCSYFQCRSWKETKEQAMCGHVKTVFQGPTLLHLNKPVLNYVHIYLIRKHQSKFKICLWLSLFNINDIPYWKYSPNSECFARKLEKMFASNKFNLFLFFYV